MTLLALENLHAGYGQGLVIHDLSLQVGLGEIAVLLGANGAGKTTLLRAISGVIAATGRVRLEGADLTRRSAAARTRAGIAHVPQGRGTFADLSVMENIRLGAYTRGGRAEIAADIERWLGVFPVLRQRAELLAGSLSGGEQQMLAIVRALMSRPRLLLLDEPSLGLAPLITQQLFSRLAELNRDSGIAMLIVEQNAQLALAIARSAYLLESGRIVGAGSAADVLTQGDLRRAYLGY